MSALLDEFGIGDAQERAESWRYSANALRALERQEFTVADSHADLPQALIDRLSWPQSNAERLVFINGALSTRHSTAGVIESLVKLSNENARVVLTVGSTQTNPLHIVYANIAGDFPGRWRTECDVDVTDGSATILEEHVGDDGVDVVGSVSSNVSIGPNATLNVFTIGDIPPSVSLSRRLHVRVGSHATFNSTHALAGGRLQRFDIACDLAEAHARCAGRGVFAPSSREHIDIHLDVRHVARDTASDVLWRGIADQRGRGILRGAITVAQGADGADAQLQTKNLLLSSHAEIDAQPVLEIYADEVKASHGATVGQLDEQSLFYLRSRGIPRAEARALLIAGFAREAFGFAEGAMRERFDAWLVSHRHEAIAP
ncbi:MAG: SufD family Fe-S cluster assembly protein [Rudaea sp.]